MSDPKAARAARCVVRPARVADLAELVVLFAEHARHECAVFHPEGVTARLRDALWSNPPRLRGWVADSAAGLIGYATAAPEFSTWAACEYLHMDCLFVRDGWRGAGIGAALLAAVAGHACDQGYPEVQWQTPAWNEDAARFYRRNGAAEKSKRRFALDLRHDL
ncbi:MAG: GNAT family N-acetyltransferase [Rhodanobacteraceae bacterium]